MSLRSFLKDMEAKGEVVHVSDSVSPCFEASSVMKAFDGGPIISFDHVKGYGTRVVANVCGTRGRLCSASGVSPENLYEKLTWSWQFPTPPKIVKEGPVKDVVEKAKLSRLPILTHFEKDAGPYITSAIVSARSPDGKVENVSIHRLQVLDDTHLAVRLVPRHLFQLWKMAKDEKRDLEVAITLGLHPVISLAATSPLPFGVSEFGVANVLLENGLRLTRCATLDAYGPADAEIMLEGVMSTEKEMLEGPLVDITGTYDAQRNQPIIEVINVMRREDYLYQALLPSGTEHKLLMGLPRETRVWEAVKKVVPVVKAVNFTVGGCGWLHAVISIEKQTDGDAKNAILAAFGAHGSLKHAVVVDTDIDVYNMSEVEWALATRFQGDEDLVIIKHARGSTLDPSGDQEQGLTTKVGFDATRPLSKPHEAFEKARIPESPNIDRMIRRLGKLGKG